MMLYATGSLVGYGPFGYVVIVVVAVVAALVTLIRSNQSFLKDDNAALRAGREDDEREIKHWKEKYAEAHAEWAREHGENKILRELNSNQPQFNELTSAINSLKEVMTAILDGLLERNRHEPT